MVKKFGSQSIVASIDVKKTLLGRYKLYDSSGSCSYDAKFLENHLQQLLHVGVGEIMLGSIDKDGTLSGPDLNIIKKVSEKIRIPLISIGEFLHWKTLRTPCLLVLVQWQQVHFLCFMVKGEPFS